MTDKRQKDEDRAALAAEHALRLLTDEEARQAQGLESGDPAFAQEVRRWRGRTAPLFDEVGAVAAPAAVWDRIDEATGGERRASNVIPFQRRVGFWRAATGAMTALAAALAVILLFEPRATITPLPQQAQVPASAPLVAMLGDRQQMKVVASWDPDAQQLVLAVAGDMPADPAHAHELWVIPADGKPRSLGTMGTAKQSHMKLADALAALLQQGATIAISVEPPGGSPTGAPTGPVVASGALSKA